jgi:serine/threonine protein kinase
VGKIFLKKYNPETKYASHLTTTRCQSEYVICEYLSEFTDHVVKPLFSDPDSSVNIFKFYDSINLSDLLKSEIAVKLEAMKKSTKALAEIHKISATNYIKNIEYKLIEVIDVERYFKDCLECIWDHNKIKRNYGSLEIGIMGEVFNLITENRLVWGNMNAHSDNILFDNYSHKAIYCDFEKAYPHAQHIDLISLIFNKGLSKNEIDQLVQYYTTEMNISNTNHFMQTLDLFSIMENLRAIRRIILAQKEIIPRWIMTNGKQEKLYIKDEQGGTKLWSEKRGENIDSRLSNIYDYTFYRSQYSDYLRSVII